MGMILRIASSRIVGQGDIVGRSGYFSLNLSANSVMRGRLDARRTLKSLVADLRLTCYFFKILLVSVSRTPKVKRGLQGITILVADVYFHTIHQNYITIIVHINVANVDDERAVNTLEHIRVQLWLNVAHWARLSVTLSFNHVDYAVVLHCLNISNVTDGDSLASHATTNQEYIGWIQTLV